MLVDWHLRSFELIIQRPHCSFITISFETKLQYQISGQI